MYIAKDVDGSYAVSNKEIKIIETPLIDKKIKFLSTKTYEDFIKSDSPFEDIVIIPKDFINEHYLNLNIFEIKEL